MMNDLINIEDLPEEERKLFGDWIGKTGCTCLRNRDGSLSYYLIDYKSWKAKVSPSLKELF